MKVLSTIALLGSVRHVFAEPAKGYTPAGRFELKHSDPDKMTITETGSGLSGEVYFTSSNDSRFDYFVEYYDMAPAGDDPTTCLAGTRVDVTGTLTNEEIGAGSLAHTDAFELPASVWNGGDTAVICARMIGSVDGEDVDAIETIATVNRFFTTSPFSITVPTKTKTVEALNEDTIEVELFLCDDNDERLPDQGVAFAQGQDFKICVAENTGAHQIEAITNVVCYFGDEVADTLVDESGNAQGLVEVSAPGAVMSFKGVVKSKYLEYGNGELSCTGDVEVAVTQNIKSTKSVNRTVIFG